MNLLNDIYYSKDYVSLYLKENEGIFEFYYEDDGEYFYNISIKRPIEKIGNILVNDGYFDLETAYGYGGFLTNSRNKEFLDKAFFKYNKKCLEDNIIAEFLRFHPFNTFPIVHQEYFDMNHYDRDVVYVDLQLSKEERWKNYSSKTRNILRKCEKNLSFNESFNLEGFVELYEKTMDRNHANEFYYFSNKYYEKLLLNKNIGLYEVQNNEELASSSFFMFSKDFGHYHLSANNYEMRQYNANYFILEQIFEIAKKRGQKYFILGGGTTSEAYDSLFKFKKKFSSFVKPFYISGKVYNNEIYDEYTKIWQKQSTSDIKYFLKYRMKI